MNFSCKLTCFLALQTVQKTHSGCISVCPNYPHSDWNTTPGGRRLPLQHDLNSLHMELVTYYIMHLNSALLFSV